MYLQSKNIKSGNLNDRLLTNAGNTKRDEQAQPIRPTSLQSATSSNSRVSQDQNNSAREQPGIFSRFVMKPLEYLGSFLTCSKQTTI